MKAPNYEDFQYAGRTLDGSEIDEEAVRRVAAARTRVDAPSTDAQLLGVFTATPENPKGSEIIVRATAWSDDNGRPEGGLFDAYLAEATGRRVMAVNAPGVDYFAADEVTKRLSRLTPEQQEELRLKGSFCKVGRACMQALCNAAVMNGEDAPSFVVSASSMGVALSAGMLREAFDSDAKVAGAIFAEPVNHISRPVATLAGQFLWTNTTAPGYINMNPEPLVDVQESFPFYARRVLDGRTANLAYVRALAAGTFYADLGLGTVDGLTGTKTPLYVTHGTASRLALNGHAGNMRYFLDYLGPNGRPQHDTFEGHDHPYTMTVQSVVNGVARVLKHAA